MHVYTPVEIWAYQDVISIMFILTSNYWPPNQEFWRVLLPLLSLLNLVDKTFEARCLVADYVSKNFVLLFCLMISNVVVEYNLCFAFRFFSSHSIYLLVIFALFRRRMFTCGRVNFSVHPLNNYIISVLDCPPYERDPRPFWLTRRSLLKSFIAEVCYILAMIQYCASVVWL